MTCIIVGQAKDASALGLADAMPVAPADFGHALRHATSAVILGPRYLTDRDTEMLNQLPCLLVATDPVDLTHLEMHLRAGRLYLTPFDAVLLGDDAARHRGRVPWIAPFLVDMAGAGRFASTPQRRGQAPYHSLPPALRAGHSFGKAVLVRLAAAMRAIGVPRYDLVVAPTTPAAATLINCAFALPNVALGPEEELPADVLFGPPEEIAAACAGGAARETRLLVCPTVLSAAMPLEMAVRIVADARCAPCRLADARLSDRLPGQAALACLTFETG